VTPGTITVQLPELVNESGANPIQISNGCTTVSSNSDFLLEGVQINEFSHHSGIIGVSVISATGSNFSLRPEDYSMIVNGAEVDLSMKDLTENQIAFFLPGTVQPGKQQISLKVQGKAYIHSTEFEFISPWSRKSDMPVEHFGVYGSTFVLGENIYFANGYESGDRDFWMYDPARDNWEQKSDIPGTPYSKRIAFTNNEIGYLGTGVFYSSISASCDFYSYDPESDTWQFIGYMDSTEVNGGYFGSIAFSTEEKGYLFGGVAQGDRSIFSETKYWEFTPQTNQWQSLGDFQGFEEIWKLVSPAGFAINNKFYMGVGRIWNDEYTTRFWEYDPALDQWREIREFPGVPREGAVGFALNGEGYVGLGESEENEALRDFWVYSPETDQWRRTADFDGPPREGAVSAVVRNRAYVGMSGFGNDLWEFDPEIPH
jgi:N-acetylneuraminic acid mutarotase